MPPDPDRREASGPAGATRSLEDQLAAARRRIAECEAALEASEARFRNVIDGHGDAIVVVGQDGVVRYANAMAGRILCVEPGKLRGTPFGFPVLAGETTEVDLVVNGTTRLAEMRVTEATWDGHTVRLAALRDMTEREMLRRERTAQIAETLAAARLRELISQAPVAIAVLRGPEHRYEITNARYDELIGQRRVTGMPVREALPELAGQGIYELLDSVYATGTPYEGTEIRLSIERRPGVIEETFFSFVYQPLRGADGDVSAIAIVASDVTSHVRARTEVEKTNQQLHRQAAQLAAQAAELEKQYDQAQALAAKLEAANLLLEETYESERQARAEAEKANKAKSAFLAQMSHELRTPLNAIGGYADLILAGIRGPITEAQRVDLDRINVSQRHLLSVINDILNFAKVEAGKLKLNLRDVSMNAVLGELESLVAPTLMKKQLAYHYRCCDPSYTAHVDAERLQQILLNLLSNAAKFTPPGGSITVECGATPTTMRVRVRDTGVGIPAEKLESVFEPFVQLERGQTSEMSGTGLGLSISRDLARAMGGDLEAESSVNEGATFTLTLPRTSREHLPRVATPDETRSSATARGSERAPVADAKGAP